MRPRPNPSLSSNVRRPGRLGSAIVRVWCFETFAALTNGEQDARPELVTAAKSPDEFVLDANSLLIDKTEIRLR